MVSGVGLIGKSTSSLLIWKKSMNCHKMYWLLFCQNKSVTANDSLLLCILIATYMHTLLVCVHIIKYFWAF